jgi:hypothetical protein
MFGWLQEGKVHAGRVNISDAKLTSTSDWRKNVYIREFALNTPRSNHRRFYYDVRNEKRGRKFYYHHTPTPAKGVFDRHEINTKPVAVARAGLTFGFKVDFSDLEAPELGLLVYALQLEDDWFHKLGYGKPLGFGTVKVTIEEIALLPPNRYENWDINYTPLDKLSAEAMGIEGILALPSPDIKARWQVMSGG